jgi:hypothetical protein
LISGEGSDNLPPLPLIPYAMSLSTTMVYRAFRDGQREPQAAHDDLKRCCTTLDVISQRWTSAKGIARLARRLLKVFSQNAEGAPRPPRLTRSILLTPEDQPSNPPAQRRVAQPTAMNAAAHLPQDPSHVVYAPPLDGAQPGILDASYNQLDLAFNELFDYGIPNVFRDLTTWGDRIATTNDEASSAAGSDFLLSAYFNSPSMDLNGFGAGPG